MVGAELNSHAAAGDAMMDLTEERLRGKEEAVKGALVLREEEPEAQAPVHEPEEQEAPVHEPEEEEAPEMNMDMVFAVLVRLLTKAMYRCSVFSTINACLREPFFLKNHLSPQAPCINDIAGAFLLQPADKDDDDYTHLAILHHHWLLLGRCPVAAPTFIERTVRDLDVCLVASYGWLLLGRSPAATAYLVCLPKEDRCIKIPLPNIADATPKTAAGLWYEIDTASGELRFSVIMLVGLSDTHLTVEKFSSEEANWDTSVVEHEAVARIICGGVCPGISTTGCFFWKPRDSGVVIALEPFGANHLTVLAEPPSVERYPRRISSSLGSTGGRLRLCAFDVATKEAYGFEKLALDGRLSVWVKEEGGCDELGFHFSTIRLPVPL